MTAGTRSRASLPGPCGATGLANAGPAAKAGPETGRRKACSCSTCWGYTDMDRVGARPIRVLFHPGRNSTSRCCGGGDPGELQTLKPRYMGGRRALFDASSMIKVSGDHPMAPDSTPGSAHTRMSRMPPMLRRQCTAREFGVRILEGPCRDAVCQASCCLCKHSVS